MAGEFEGLFRKMLRKAQQKPKPTERKPDLGDTEAGRALSGGTPRKTEIESEEEVGGGSSWNIREIGPYRGHASKAHGARKTVRKVVVSWK